MNDTLWLAPPIAFVVVLAAAMLLSWGMSRLSFRRARQAPGTAEPYACGEDIPTHMIQPNYGQFLPFAFFFTILHVVALTIATVPSGSRTTLAFALIYIIGAMLGLSVLYRK